MTRKRQKDKELTVFDVFRKQFQEYPLPPANVDERPDLLVKCAGQTIGIEIIDLLTPEYKTSERPYGTRALDGIRKRIVRDAQRLYQVEMKVPLAVKVWFSTHMKHVKLPPRRSQEISKALCDFMKEWVVLSRADDVLRPDERIPEIWQVSVYRAVSLSQWERVSPPWLGDLSMEDVQQRIDRKSTLYSAYRQKCHQCWLLMVTDRYEPAQAFRPSFYEALRKHPFAFVFDRVFVLEVCPGHENLIQLSKVENEAAGFLAC